jgi:hypothetical protein
MRHWAQANIADLKREWDRRANFMKDKMPGARVTLTSSLTQENPPPSYALARTLAPWLSASATKFTHPDKQVQVTLTREQEVLEAMLSLPEAEAAIRQLMQAYANALGKSLQLCAYPSEGACTFTARATEGDRDEQFRRQRS